MAGNLATNMVQATGRADASLVADHSKGLA